MAISGVWERFIGESPFFETPNLSFEGRVRKVASEWVSERIEDHASRYHFTTSLKTFVTSLRVHAHQQHDEPQTQRTE